MRHWSSEIVVAVFSFFPLPFRRCWIESRMSDGSKRGDTQQGLEIVNLATKPSNLL